jgi:Na+/phosphate symporter
MGKNKNLLAAGIILIVCFMVIAFCGTIRGSEDKLKIEPEITLPEHQSDISRVIDSYERMMDRLMNLMEKNFTGINTDVKDIAVKLTLIDNKLTELSARIARIENALNIKQPTESVGKTPEVKKDANDILKIEPEKP